MFEIRYEAEVINVQGNKIKLRINPQTGDIFNHLKIQRSLYVECRQKVEEAGYRNIYNIKVDNDKYEVKALDKMK